jgi:hypothetical protein
MMEQMMSRMGGGGGDGPTLKYESLGGKKTIAGFACETYKVSMGDRVLNESCFAPWTSKIVTKAEAAEWQKLGAEFAKIFGGMPGVRQLDWSKSPGVPIEQVTTGEDGSKTVNTLKSISRGQVPASLFEVPAGFTKQERTVGKGGPRGMGPRGMGPGGPGMGPGGPGAGSPPPK